MTAAIPADTPLADLEFVAFDLETTGCVAAGDAVVEVGAVRFGWDGGVIDGRGATFQSLVNPRRRIPPNVIRVHGITDADVAEAPPVEDVLPGFVDFLGDPAGTVLMAHNARFDMGFVGAALYRGGFDAPPHAVVDTVRLSRKRMPRADGHSLRKIARRFGVAETTDHRGLSDSLVLRDVFLHLAHRPPAVRTFGQLDALCGCGPLRSEIPTPGPTTGRRWPARRSAPAGTTEEARLTAAIALRRSVRIVYDGGTKGAGRRDVTPRDLVRRGGDLYLLAWCHADGREKRYRMDRIREVE